MWQRLFAPLILCSIALVNPLQAFAQQTQSPSAPPPPPDYYWHGPWGPMWGGGNAWHFWWMFPMMMFFMVICFAVIFFLARSFCGHGSHYGSHSWGPPSQMMNRAWEDPSYSALQILNERFARGEIQNAEYAEKKATILSSRR